MCLLRREGTFLKFDKAQIHTASTPYCFAPRNIPRQILNARRNEPTQNSKGILSFILTPLVCLSGCQKLAPTPKSQDNFIIVPPRNLIVIGAQDAAILLYWDPVFAVGFSYYNVYFATKATNLRLTAETLNNSFFIDSLNYDSTYFFK